MQRTTNRLFLIAMLMLVLSAPFTAQKKEKNGTQEKEKNVATLPAVIWRDPGNVASLNLFYGVGGKEHAPDPNGKFTFVEEDLKKSSPKLRSQGAKGGKATGKLRTR